MQVSVAVAFRLTSWIPAIKKLVVIEMLHSSLRALSDVVEGGSSSDSKHFSLGVSFSLRLGAYVLAMSMDMYASTNDF